MPACVLPGKGDIMGPSMCLTGQREGGTGSEETQFSPRGLPSVDSTYLEHLPGFDLQVTVPPQPMSTTPPHMWCLVGSRMIGDFLEPGTLCSLPVFASVAALALFL